MTTPLDQPLTAVPHLPGPTPAPLATGGAAGRSCPLDYRYRPEDLATAWQEDAGACEVLYVVGGLYGNEPALDEVLRLFERERGPKRLVFNGDFHWFDLDAARFERIGRAVLAASPTRGNVETELGAASAASSTETDLAEEADDAGCGCAYPEWVGDGVVQRSNRILRRLRATARGTPVLAAAMAALPMWRRIEVGGCRVAVVHGDAESLAGWGFAQEHLGPQADAAHCARVAGWFDRAQVDVFASSHTCLPVLHTWQGGQRVLVNNGAAGMPNLAGERTGLLTRIAVSPPADAAVRAARRYGHRLATARGEVQVDGLAVAYDTTRFARDFLADWPPGSDAHTSYWARIDQGSEYALTSVVRHA